MSDVAAAVEAIESGSLAIVPTDTVYGLAASPHSEAPVRRLYAAKGRVELQPTALVAARVEGLLELLPELPERARAIVRALLPGAYTIVLPNPAGRYPWLTGERRDAIGVRVPLLGGPGGEVLGRVGALVATSANLPGGPDPRILADVPDELRSAAAVAVDGGALPGVASTVIDVTGTVPVVLREGAVPSAEALERVRAATS